MDVLKISESKIKIMLSREDTERLGLDAISADYSDTEVRSKVWNILSRVKSDYGFDYEGEKLLIQFYPSKDGGAELFITKLLNLQKKNEKVMSKSENVTMLDTKPRIYKFDKLDELIRAAKIIKRRGGVASSELFYSEEDGYYLNISERGALRFDHICEFAIISEFATPVAKEKYPYITEHFEKLAEDSAIELLSSL